MDGPPKNSKPSRTATLSCARRADRFKHLEAVEHVTLDWADWCNHLRLLQPIGDVSPAEFKQRYRNQPAGQAKAA